ncbi:MAG: DUF4417 domain-containing protein [Faecalibacterium sp.]|nr:DUF4417 domain-containing protein [Ruminococcus sp.]MCM1391727.1 DUF4417 domain-containing protein [Ruminococcus sp.]MCM1485360.1 DUF4417 domain-containing protein [Faecalibacterium sp.]
MTLENFNYRTDPLFLRNDFISQENWSMPIIPHAKINIDINNSTRVIGFDRIKNNQDNHLNRLVHFFLYDYKFEDIWINPQKYIDALSKYPAILSPDFSMYIEMHPIMQLYNTFRNRWVGAFLSSKGISVIPTINWGLDNTFKFCFNGIEKGSTVAVSTYMVSEHGNHRDQKNFFMRGYNEMLKQIEPEKIICYHYPFEEMKGNIVYIDYDLSSWRHYEDDIVKSNNVKAERIKHIYGYVSNYIKKGTGSAYGGDWKPKKKDDERFLGTPNSIKQYVTKNNEVYETKIGSDGRAYMERHHTTHHREHTGHTNPHDHMVDWSRGFPSLGEPINYPHGNIPIFKFKGGNLMSANISQGKFILFDDYDEMKFEGISDFKWSVQHGSEVEFNWKGKSYGIGLEAKDTWVLYQANTAGSDVYFKSVDELLNFKIDDDILRDIVTEIEVTVRTL